jgi:predicted PurR-regulated permease PerM
MFWWPGLPLPLLCGTVMGMLVAVPVVGAFAVWVPAAIYLVFEGELGKALILTFGGGVVVASIDNLLYPTLVGNRLKLHDIPALIGTLGGVVLFGAAGLVLGLATISVRPALLEILKWRFNRIVSP